MLNYNLVVSCPRGHEKGAISEIRYFLEGLLGDHGLIIDRSSISGMVLVHTSLDPHYVIKRLYEFVNENPYQFSFAIRFLPVDICVEANLEKITEAAKFISNKIAEHEKFRITVKKRDTNLSSHDIIKVVANEIDRMVDLENPDKIVLIEIIGPIAFFSVLENEELILSIRKYQ